MRAHLYLIFPQVTYIRWEACNFIYRFFHYIRSVFGVKMKEIKTGINSKIVTPVSLEYESAMLPCKQMCMLIIISEKLVEMLEKFWANAVLLYIYL